MKIQPWVALVVLSLPTVPGGRAVRGSKARTLGLLALACLLVAAPATAQVNYAISGGTAYVGRSPGASGAIVIASSFNGFPVTSIAGRAFEGSGLTSVTIPSSVTSIGDFVFRDCFGLTNVSVDAANPAYSSLTGVLFDKAQTTLITFPIGRGGSYVIPNSVTRIVSEAFYNGNWLTSVTIPTSVTSIGSYVFNNCVNLTSVTIPDSVTGIGSWAFDVCTSLTNVTMGNSVTSIGYQAFSDCTGLTSVTFPNSVTDIGRDAFSRCRSLFGVTIPNHVTNIGAAAFNGCTNLTSLTIGNSVTSIGGGAFSGCTSLTNMILGSSVTRIGSRAFERCANVTSVRIPSSVTSIEDGAFSACARLTNFTFLGNAPALIRGFFEGGWFAFVGAGAKAYYDCGTTGWGTNYGLLPTVMLCPPQIAPGGVGVKPGGFGFTLTRLTNQTIVVEASTNLPNWRPIWTNTLPGTSSDFVDPEWLNHSNRFYRARSD